MRSWHSPHGSLTFLAKRRESRDPYLVISTKSHFDIARGEASKMFVQMRSDMRGRNFRCPSSVFVVSPHPETDQLIDQLTTHDRKRAISKEKSNFPRPAPLKLLFKCGRDNAGVRRATPHVRCGASLLARRARATSRTDLVRTCACPTYTSRPFCNPRATLL